MNNTNYLLTFFLFLDGRHFAQKATQIVAGKKMHIKLGSTYGNFESKSTRMDTDQKSVELHGDVNEISRDVLEMYLESEKKSGGGNLEHFDLDANPPIAVFEDPKGMYAFRSSSTIRWQNYYKGKVAEKEFISSVR